MYNKEVGVSFEISNLRWLGTRGETENDTKNGYFLNSHCIYFYTHLCKPFVKFIQRNRTSLFNNNYNLFEILLLKSNLSQVVVCLATKMKSINILVPRSNLYIYFKGKFNIKLMIK